MQGLIVVYGSKSISSIAGSVLSASDIRCIYKFLNRFHWDYRLLNRNRIAYLNLFLEKHINSKSVGFLVIDDTVNPKPTAKKIEDLSYHFFHAEGKSVWSIVLLLLILLQGILLLLSTVNPTIEKSNVKI